MFELASKSMVFMCVYIVSEVLYEDASFAHRELAALVASKVCTASYTTTHSFTVALVSRENVPVEQKSSYSY